MNLNVLPKKLTMFVTKCYLNPNEREREKRGILLPLEKKFANSRMIRALKFDLSQPLAAKVVGEYLAPASAARDYPAGQKQEKISWSDAEWIRPDQLLVVEHGKGLVKLLLVDFGEATNFLARRDAGPPIRVKK